MHNPEQYSITTRLINVDGENFYEASVRELPDLRVYAADPTEAYLQAVDAISAASSLAVELGKAFPAPAPDVDDEEASGRITLRLPRQLHGKLTRMAADDEVSLNVYILGALARFEGFKAGYEIAKKEVPETRAARKAVAGYYDVNYGHSDVFNRWDTEKLEQIEISVESFLESVA